MSDYTTLRDMDPRHFVTVGQDLHKVAVTQDTAFGDYEPGVVAPVRSGTIWKDAAQPDGVAVLEVQSRSYDTSAKLLSAAAVTSVTLGLELTSAKAAVTEAISQAAQLKLDIDRDGHVDVSDERWMEDHTPRLGSFPTPGLWSTGLRRIARVCRPSSTSPSRVRPMPTPSARRSSTWSASRS